MPPTRRLKWSEKWLGLEKPARVAVDGTGNVYVAETVYADGVEKGRVVRLAAGSNTQTTLPFTEFSDPKGIAVDSAGSVYVVDGGHERVLTLAAGSDTQTEVPFAGLGNPWAVAVDGAGNVYVADRGTAQIVKLAAP